MLQTWPGHPCPKVYPPVDISNDFRQVSVLPHIGKILERVQLQLNQKDITLRPSQYGFTKDHSTTSALIAITQPWFNATDSTCRDTVGIHALFIDFRKAFDHRLRTVWLGYHKDWYFRRPYSISILMT